MSRGAPHDAETFVGINPLQERAVERAAILERLKHTPTHGEMFRLVGAAAVVIVAAVWVVMMFVTQPLREEVGNLRAELVHFMVNR